ncbi:MAG: caspase family protein [Prevotella sp.]|nr:caspase family protein [Prevotella sp.]
MKKNGFNKLVGAICFCFISFTANAQTLHTIVFCNTIDGDIGESMKVELMNVTNQFKKINDLIEYDMDFYKLDGPICTRANLKRAIDQLEVDEDDVILTFYGGHGSHAPNDSDPWPQYCMNTGFEDQSNWVRMATVAKWVWAKKPRLAIILSNCCNVIQGATTVKPLWAMGGDYTSLDGISADKYKELFSAKGLVMATSSKVPEPSWCNNVIGGLFTSDLIDALQNVGSGEVSPDWNSVLKWTSDRCSEKDIVDRNYKHHRQHPLFRITDGKEFGDKGKDIDGDDDGGDGIIDNDAPLQQALNELVNKNINQDVRLDMRQVILNRYFSGISKVRTVGTDMKTVVEYENPADFLRRICLSPYIKKVNVLNKDKGTLIVHEIRTQ